MKKLNDVYETFFVEYTLSLSDDEDFFHDDECNGTR